MTENTASDGIITRQVTDIPGTDEAATDGFLQSLMVIWRAKWTVLSIAMVPLAFFAFYAFVQATPQYMARVQLSLNVKSNDIADIASMVSGVSTEGSAINTELQIMRSRKLIAQLVDRLDLSNDPEFSPSLQEPSFFARMKGWLGASSAATTLSPDVMRQQAINYVRQSISAVALRSTYILEIRATTGDRAKSALIANTLAEIYISDQIGTKFDSTEYAVNWLSERVTELEDELREKETSIKDLLAQSELINEESLNALTLRAKDLRDRLSRLEETVNQQQASADALRILVETGTPQQIVDQTNDPALRRFMTSTAGDLAGNTTAFNTRAATLVGAAAAEVSRTQTQRDALQETLAQLDTEIASQSRDLSTLTQLTRERDATRVLYETFLARLKESSLQIGFQQADSRIMEEARPGRLVAPQPTLLLTLGLILGIILGSAIVLLRHFTRLGVQTATQLEQATHLPVIGQIPLMPFRRRDGLISYITDNPTSAPIEAMRNLRTSILLSNPQKPPQVILSTSSVPSEGKTTQVIGLAASLAGTGSRVLLVGADTRRQAIAEYFPDLPKHNLIDAIIGECSIEEATLHHDGLGIDVITGLAGNINPANLFSSSQFNNFLDTVRDQYDYVVLDSPPVLLVPDARILAQHADAVIFSVYWDSTPLAQVKDGIRQLNSVGVPVTGLVLSRVNMRKMPQYAYGGAYRNYSTYEKGYN